VICQDVRANTSVSEYVDWVDYCVKLVGVDHIGVAAQDDFHRSYKDTQRITPYVPSYATELKKRDWSDDRVYRAPASAPTCSMDKTWRRSSNVEIIRKQPSAKSSATIYSGSCARFCHKHLLMPMIERNGHDSCAQLNSQM